MLFCINLYQFPRRLNADLFYPELIIFQFLLNTYYVYQLAL